MDDRELAELERLEREATPGPWRLAYYDGPNLVSRDHGAVAVCLDCVKLPDIMLMGAARNALPSLLSEVRRLRERLSQAEGLLRRLAGDRDDGLCSVCGDYTSPCASTGVCCGTEARAFLAGSPGEGPTQPAPKEPEDSLGWRCEACGEWLREGDDYGTTPDEVKLHIKCADPAWLEEGRAALEEKEKR